MKDFLTKPLTFVIVVIMTIIGVKVFDMSTAQAAKLSGANQALVDQYVAQSVPPAGNCDVASSSCVAASFTTTGVATGQKFVSNNAAGNNGLELLQQQRIALGSSGADVCDIYYAGGNVVSLLNCGLSVTHPSNGTVTATFFTASAANGSNLINLTDSTNAKTSKLRNNNDKFEIYDNANTLEFQNDPNTGGVGAPNGYFVSRAGAATYASINVISIGQFTIDATVHNSGADTTEDTLWTYTLPASALSATGKSLRITAWGDGVSTADVTTVRCYFGATVVVTKVLTASQANTWRTVFEVTRTGATTQNASGTLWNGGTAASFAQTNTTPAETLSGSVVIKCTGQRATSSVANSVRQLYALGEFIN